MDEREKAAHSVLIERLRGIGVHCEGEKCVSFGTRGKRRWRSIDVAAYADSGEVWVEIDGPNHRGLKNLRRDTQLAGLALQHKARLIHWPLFRIMDEGIMPVVHAIMDPDFIHLGHAQGDYSTYSARHYS